jgi:hypothetical protein
MRGLGYWFMRGSDPTLPLPQRFVDPAWSRDERAAVLAYLRSGRVWRSFMGCSYCRICGQEDRAMGCADLTDGEWVWPEGLAHYVEQHDVRLPQEFVDTVLAAPAAPRAEDGEAMDMSWWMELGRARGACHAMDAGWRAVNEADNVIPWALMAQLEGMGETSLIPLKIRGDADLVLCGGMNYRVVRLHTGETLATASEADEAEFTRIFAAPPPVPPPALAALQAYAERVGREPHDFVHMWLPDQAVASIGELLGARRVSHGPGDADAGGRWVRFDRADG